MYVFSLEVPEISAGPVMSGGEDLQQDVAGPTAGRVGRPPRVDSLAARWQTWVATR